MFLIFYRGHHWNSLFFCHPKFQLDIQKFIRVNFQMSIYRRSSLAKKWRIAMVSSIKKIENIFDGPLYYTHTHTYLDLDVQNLWVAGLPNLTCVHTNNIIFLRLNRTFSVHKYIMCTLLMCKILFFLFDFICNVSSN